MTPIELTQTIARILDSKKAQDIQALHTEDVTAIADYFVIATGSSTNQVRALVDELEFQLKENHGITPLRIEGYDTRNWVVLDYNAVVVHVLYPEQRDFYALENLWADATEVELNLEG
ncbi:ribosome silencing factor [Ruminococcaceae bacterium OttesenSCG-928-N02]|nr:ribosome silencing factor [Ruminococcaceae bacterium OttesenSCG-928-N02]